MYKEQLRGERSHLTARLKMRSLVFSERLHRLGVLHAVVSWQEAVRNEVPLPGVTASGLRKELSSSKVYCKSSRNKREEDDWGLEKYVDAGGVRSPGVSGCMHRSDSDFPAISS
jgi:hypothetical protein